MSIESIRQGRGMPFLHKGMRVLGKASGMYGAIVGATADANIRVRVDGQDRIETWHPQWRVTYFGSDGSVIAEYDG